MNDQELHRALFECVRDRSERTVRYRIHDEKEQIVFQLNLLILTFDMLFFPYEHLCVSSHDAVAGYSWSG